ncbi:MAG: hypothetical protein ACRDTT_34525, partial [Pseudonocardiaceae bacterium]
MGGIRAIFSWAFAGVVACVILLLAAPTGHAVGFGAGRQPPPGGDPSPLRGDPPTLTLVPATASAGALVKAVGEGFAVCVTANGQV